MSRRPEGAPPEDRVLLALLLKPNTATGIRELWRKKGVDTSVGRYSEFCRKCEQKGLIKGEVEIIKNRRIVRYSPTLEKIGGMLILRWEQNAVGKLTDATRPLVYEFLKSDFLKTELKMYFAGARKPHFDLGVLETVDHLLKDILWRVGSRSANLSDAEFYRIITDLHTEKNEKEEEMDRTRRLIEWKIKESKRVNDIFKKVISEKLNKQTRKWKRQQPKSHINSSLLK